MRILALAPSKAAFRFVGLLLLFASLLSCGGTGPSYDPVSITTTSLADAVVGTEFGQYLTATGGDGPYYTWALSSGTLPPGLTLYAANGLVAGTPTTAGVWNFTVHVTIGDTQTATKALSITITNPALVITTSSLPNGVVGMAYTQYLTATGGGGSYTWSVTVGSLPVALSLDAATGGIMGTPSVVGSNPFTVQVASGDGQTAEQALSITVILPIVLEPSELCSNYPDYAIATFEDAKLEARVALSVGAQEHLTCGLISGLTRLSAHKASITSSVGIQNLTSLYYLYLSDNSITNIWPLSGLTSLSQLDLSQNSITNIWPLSVLTSLTYLDLYDNSISDISALSGLTSLTSLVLSDNSITDISALSGPTSLTSLVLSDNSITDISALSGLTSLSYLILNNNPNLTDISALSGLTSLTYLDLSDNSITDISALSALTSLTYLDLSGNSITDIHSLLNNSGLGAGDIVDLRSTNVSCTDVAALRANGVTVYSYCS